MRLTASKVARVERSETRGFSILPTNSLYDLNHLGRHLWNGGCSHFGIPGFAALYPGYGQGWEERLFRNRSLKKKVFVRCVRAGIPGAARDLLSADRKQIPHCAQDDNGGDWPGQGEKLAPLGVTQTAHEG